MTLGGFQWLQPEALLLLLLIPPMVWGALRRRPTLRFPPLSGLAELSPGPLARLGWLPLSLRVAAVALATLALARPVSPEPDAARDLSVEGIDIVLALDLSGSMRAADFQPKDRLHVAKEVLDDFVGRRPNDRIGLVVFAGDAYTQCPPTLDHGVLRSILQQVDIGGIEDGTAIGNAIATSLNRLRDSDADSRVVILITDGDSNAGTVSPLDAAAMAKELGIGVYTILVGQDCEPGEPCLAPFPAGRDAFGNVMYRQVNLPVNFPLLQEIAEITGAHAYRATDRASLEGNLQDVLARLERSRLVEERQLTSFAERFDRFLLVALLLAFVEIAWVASVGRPFP